jgi:hypothetical protein
LAAIAIAVPTAAHFARADERSSFSGELPYIASSKLWVVVLDANSKVRKVVADAGIDYDTIVVFLTFSSEESPSYLVMPMILNFTVVDEDGMEHLSLGNVRPETTLSERMSMMNYLKELETRLQAVSEHWAFFLTDSRRIRTGQENGFIMFMLPGLPPMDRWRKVFVKDAILGQDIELLPSKYVFSTTD